MTGVCSYCGEECDTRKFGCSEYCKVCYLKRYEKQIEEGRISDYKFRTYLKRVFGIA